MRSLEVVWTEPESSSEGCVALLLQGLLPLESQLTWGEAELQP